MLSKICRRYFIVICGVIFGTLFLMEWTSVGISGSIREVAKRIRPFSYETNLPQGKRKQNATGNIISYSLYGSNPRYTDGALENAKLCKEIYPGWTMRVYYEDTVPKNIMDKLKAANVQLVNMTGSKMNKMSWRFLGATDTKRSCSRDIDSHLSLREKAAVDQWIQSGKQFHVMRDHPNHSFYPMSGGMWCSTTIPFIDELLNSVTSQAYIEDMNFLNNVLWKIAYNKVLQHDSFSCEKWKGSLPFPTPRVEGGFVGSVYNNGSAGTIWETTEREKINKECLNINWSAANINGQPPKL